MCFFYIGIFYIFLVQKFTLHRKYIFQFVIVRGYCCELHQKSKEKYCILKGGKNITTLSVTFMIYKHQQGPPQNTM